MATNPENIGSRTQGGDSQLGRGLVEANLVTPHELQACLSKQRQLATAGKEIKLSQILVKSGFVTLSQIRRLANPADDSVSQSIQQFPGFQIMQKIGAGAMASVYKAKQMSLDRIVAIKILPKRLSEDPEFVERFHKEGRAAAKLNHNNIVQAIDVGEYNGYHYFVMEFVDGNTVYDEMLKRHRYSEKDALEVIIQIAQALEHAHNRGFIHRDVKPKNIMITKDGTAKLADMGLAREASDLQAAAEEKGRAYGTPYYISPEQIRGLEDVDFRADIYSLGATLFHMVIGRVPFEGTTPAAIMQKHLKESLVPPDHINKSLSTGLGEVVERAMAKDRNKRYASTSDLLIDLKHVQVGEAPRQARSGYNDELLKNLAAGDESEMDIVEAGSDVVSGPAYQQRSLFIPMLVGLIVEFVIIMILIIVLATG